MPQPLQDRLYSTRKEKEEAGKVYWAKNSLPSDRPCSSYPSYLLLQPPSHIPWEWLLCTLQALWSIISLLALFVLHHLVGCLNSVVWAFSLCLLTALFRAGPAAPTELKGPPRSALWFIHRTLSHYGSKDKHSIVPEKWNYNSCQTVKFRIGKHQL